jgi:hypothetical protein
MVAVDEAWPEAIFIWLGCSLSTWHLHAATTITAGQWSIVRVRAALRVAGL